MSRLPHYEREWLADDVVHRLGLEMLHHGPPEHALAWCIVVMRHCISEIRERPIQRVLLEEPVDAGRVFEPLFILARMIHEIVVSNYEIGYADLIIAV